MEDPSKRRLTVLLLAGIFVLAAAIAFGEHEGDRAIGQVTEHRIDSIAPISVTPEPVQRSAAPYGPAWKHSDVLAAPTDPGFPDPRVPPVPLPTGTPRPKQTPNPEPSPTATPTPNLNLPVWRRAAPLPTAESSATVTPVPGPSIEASPSP